MHRRGCRAFFDLGGGLTFSFDIPWISAEGLDCPLNNIADGVYNMSVALGLPYNARTHAVFAKVTPMKAPVLEVMFPPKDGYLFGTEHEPFLQLYIQDSAHSLHVAGTTANSAKRTSCYVKLSIEPQAEARHAGAQDALVWEYNPNSRKIFLGRYMQHQGQYTIRARVFDVLKRDTRATAEMQLRRTLQEESPQACSPGAHACAPQAAATSEDEQWTTISGMAEAVERVCGQLARDSFLCTPRESGNGEEGGKGTEGGEGREGGEGGEGAEREMRGEPAQLANTCNNRGRCVGGVCYCHQDAIGAACEHEVLRDLAYLPEVHPLDSATRCQQSLALERGSEALLQRLIALQYPPVCEHKGMSQRRFNKTQGLGVTLRWLGLSQLEALDSRRTLVVGGRWRAFNFEGCDERGLWCYLAPITNCSVQVWDWEEIEKEDFEMPEVLRVPEPRTDQGQLWWSAVTLQAIMRPAIDLQARLVKIKNMLGWSGRVVGLHVRHGDSCADIARKQCIPAETYFEEAE